MTKRRAFGSVRRLPSGRWQGAYWWDGRRHVAPHTFPTKTDATVWLASQEGRLLSGGWIAPAAGRATFASVADLWLASNPLKRASSRSRDQSVLHSHVLPAIGHRRLDQITRADLQTVVDGWSAVLAPSTVGRVASTMRAVFSYAVASDMLARSPAAGLRLPKAPLIDRPQLTPEQLAGLAEALGPDQAAMMWLGVVGGLRWAEAAGMTVASLDLLGGAVIVRQQLERDRVLGPPKTAAAHRRLAIPAWLVEDLAALVARRGLTAADPEALLFVNGRGRSLNYSNWRQRVWGSACAEVGLPQLRFHDLRSMAATALVAAGVDIKTAQARLGHSTPAVTLGIYARATAEADRRAADALGAALRHVRPDSVHQQHTPAV